MGLQYVECHFHGTGRLDNLRQEHLALLEQHSDLFHPLHQRTVDDGLGTAQRLQLPDYLFGEPVGGALYDHFAQSDFVL